MNSYGLESCLRRATNMIRRGEKKRPPPLSYRRHQRKWTHTEARVAEKKKKKIPRPQDGSAELALRLYAAHRVCTLRAIRHDPKRQPDAFGLVPVSARKGMVLVTQDRTRTQTATEYVVADDYSHEDSSRFWKLAERGERYTVRRDGKPVSFSKEFARGMVKSRDQQFTEEQANEIAVRYIGGVQHLTGNSFEPDLRPRDQRIVESTNLILDALL